MPSGEVEQPLCSRGGSTPTSGFLDKHSKAMGIPQLSLGNMENIQAHCCMTQPTMRNPEEREQPGVFSHLLIGFNRPVITWTSGLCAGGYFAGSLAVMTDAAHLLVDFLSFIISLLSLWLSSRPATHKLNYGWHRAGTALPWSHLSSL